MRIKYEKMTTISIDLPDTLAASLRAAEAETGSDLQELALAALRDFIDGHRYSLMETHQREDIAEALREAGVEL